MTTKPQQVRYFIEGQEIEFDSDKGAVKRMVRRALESIGKKQAKKFGHLVHPETGERPDLVIVADRNGMNAQCRLVTDSEDLRAWLKGKGIVIGEIVDGVQA